MADRKSIARLEREQPHTNDSSVGNHGEEFQSVAKPLENGAEPEPTSGAWHWLLAPDGSYATIDTVHKEEAPNQDIKDGIDSCSRYNACQDEFPADANPSHDEADRMQRNRKRKQSSWYWLLARDGSPATLDTQPCKRQKATFPNPSSYREPKGIADDTIAKAAPTKLPKQKESRGWYWLLRPDGSPATLDTAEVKREPDAISQSSIKRETKKPIRRSFADKNIAIRTTGRWCWLLNPDGSPSIVDPTVPVAARTRTCSYAPKSEDSDGESDSESDTMDDYDDGDQTEDYITDDDESDCESPSSDESCYRSRCNAPWEVKFQQLVEYKNKHKTTNVPKHDPILGRWVDTQRVQKKKNVFAEDRVRRLNSIGFVWSFRTQISWMETYKRFLSYKTKDCGLANVKSADPRLACWIHNQRSRYKRGELSDERIGLLESIGFEWGVSENEAWMKMYQRLVEYKEKHGTTHVPKRNVADPKLGRWVDNQRYQCKRKDRIELLNAIGFEWSMRNDWGVMYQRLLTYKTKHGTTRVPRHHKDDPQLAIWVKTQRSCCKMKDRVDLLDSIGFEWKVRKSDGLLNEKKWETMYQRLLSYNKRHGHTRVPSNYKDDPKLATWVKHNRQTCKVKDRIDRLNAIGFDWNPRNLPHKRSENS